MRISNLPRAQTQNRVFLTVVKLDHFHKLRRLPHLYSKKLTNAKIK